MIDNVQLQPLLNRLRLSGISETLEETFKEAMNEKWSYSKLLLHLFSKEADRRDHKQNTLRLVRSNLDPLKTFELFNFEFNNKIPVSVVKELANCDFIRKKENLFFVGPSGVGKTHIANALGVEACRKGYNVIFKRTNSLLDFLHSGNGDNTFDKKLKNIISIPLLILDDFGLIPLSDKYQIYLYEIISERYEKASTIITSNRNFNEWIEVFSNPLMGSAAMDRLVHKAIKINIEGDSYRTYEFKNIGKKLLNIENI